MTSVPPPNYPVDKQSAVARAQPYYAAPPPTVYPGLMPTQLQPQPHVQALTHGHVQPQNPHAHVQPQTAQPHVPNHAHTPAPIPAQVNAASQYYRTPITYPPPTPVTYPRLPPVEQPQRKATEAETFTFVPTVRNQLQQIATLDEIPIPIERRNETKKVEAVKESKSDAFDFATVNTADVDSTQLKLPPKWKTARDSEGRLYYYHTKTRQSQWYPPAWESRSDEDSGDSSADDDNDVEFKKKKRKKEEKVEFDVST